MRLSGSETVRWTWFDVAVPRIPNVLLIKCQLLLKNSPFVFETS